VCYDIGHVAGLFRLRQTAAVGLGPNQGHGGDVLLAFRIIQGYDPQDHIGTYLQGTCYAHNRIAAEVTYPALLQTSNGVLVQITGLGEVSLAHLQASSENQNAFA
jgi:hypothetical protein